MEIPSERWKDDPRIGLSRVASSITLSSYCILRPKRTRCEATATTNENQGAAPRPLLRNAGGRNDFWYAGLCLKDQPGLHDPQN